MSTKIRIFASVEGVMDCAARTLLEVSRTRGGGPVTVALSGGSTPTPLYQRLAGEHGDAEPWERLEIFFSDERGVPPDHPDSNYRLARDALFARVPIPAMRIHRMPAEEADLEAAALRHEAEIRSFVPGGAEGTPAFDLVWLGLGTDGHTASLFPGSLALQECGRLVVPSEGPPPHSRRLTFTFRLLAAAARIQFLVVGAEKSAAVRSVLDPSHEADSKPPAARVEAPRGEVEWLLDREAASLLQDPGLIALIESAGPPTPRPGGSTEGGGDRGGSSSR